MLSLILYGRNDSYGYNLHKRAAISLNCMAEMLTADGDEILFVDYNTPDDFPTFPEAIQDTLTERAKKLLRILRVRSHQHERYRALTNLVALEPISRNVAVRRSNPDNRWILSTNTDMVFYPRRGRSLSDVAATLPDNYYHLPRFEVPETLWESADRLDPLGTIEAFGTWGTEFHLNEVVFSQDPAVRYDAPGDFQLILRSDLWRIHGFHEQMLLGWHVDSNIAKRLALIPYRIGDVLDDFYGYHCDHTRQVTPMHRSRATENSLQVFFEEVDRPEVPEQAETWGLAGVEIEELRIGATSRVYVNALKELSSTPLAEPYVIHYSGESYNRLDYAVEHVVPFLADIFASYPRNTVVGWVGSKRSLLERFTQVWKAMGFTEPIVVLAATTWLGPDLPAGSTWAPEDEFAEVCNVYVFDWGKPEEEGQDPWRFDSHAVTSGVTRAFRRMVRLERLRIAGGAAHPRRFVGVNAINNNVERIIGDHVGVARSPLATRVRQGFVTEYREVQDLMPHLIAGSAARKRSGQIAAQAGDVGLIFYGPYIDLESSTYRLTVDVEYEPPAEGDDVDSGFSLELVSGPWLLGYHTLTIEELQRGTIQRDFRISSKIGGADHSPRIETRLRTLGRAPLTVVRANLEEIRLADGSLLQDDAQLIGDTSGFADIDYVQLLHLGPAGVPGFSAGAAGGYAIHANPGVPNYLCYGPYFWLPAGRYAASFEFMVHGVASGCMISMYVVAEQGRTIYGKGFFEPSTRGVHTHTVMFEIGEDVPTPEDGLLEFLVWTGGEGVLSLTSLRVAEVDDVAPIAPATRTQKSELLAALVTTDAGTKLPDGISTLTRVTGFAFFGPYVELSPGRYRLTLDIDRASFVQTPANESGLGIEVVRGALLLAYRELSREEVERDTVSIEFGIPAAAAESSKVEFRLWTIGIAEVVICDMHIEQLSPALPDRSFTDFDAALLLTLGPAGERIPAPLAPSRIAIHAKPGIEGNVTHGPYVWLPAGRYEAVFEFLIERGLENAAINVDIVTSLGANVLAVGAFKPQRRGLVKRKLGYRWGRLEGVLPFEVPVAVPAEDNGRLEFRTWSSGQFEFFLTGLRIRNVQDASDEGR